MDIKSNFPVGLTFDDVLLKPGYSDFSRLDIDLSTYLTSKIKLSLPLISAPMDTVTESGLAVALAEFGGIGIIHRNLTIDNQAKEVKKVKSKGLLVGAAIGVNSGFEDRVKALVGVGADVIVVDSAHGFAKPVINTVKYIRRNYPGVQIVAGNIATFEAAIALIEAGADALRVGMGPGAICTTRIISGIGVPQITAITDVLRAVKSFKNINVPIIADGGIRYSGDVVKALAAGASTVMMGSVFASCNEAPGDVLELEADQVPQRFKNVFKQDMPVYRFKTYRGMGSIGAMQKGAKIKSEDEFHGKDYKDRVLVAEGVEGLVPVNGTVCNMVSQIIGGVKSGMYYVGAKNIPQLWQMAKFIKITQSSLTESHPHDILITNPGENY